MVAPPTPGHAPAGDHSALRPKHAIVDVQQDQEDGYETDATAFSDAGGYTTEEETPHRPRHKRHWPGARMLGKPPALRSAGGPRSLAPMQTLWWWCLQLVFLYPVTVISS